MDSQSQDNSSNAQQRSNMIEETKDTVANIVTVGGTASVVMGVSEWLTLVLLVTGITFNVVRIIDIKKRKIYSSF